MSRRNRRGGVPRKLPGQLKFKPSKQGQYRINQDGSVYVDRGRGQRFLGKLKRDEDEEVLDRIMGAKR